jgi:hypothetical protein
MKRAEAAATSRSPDDIEKKVIGQRRAPPPSPNLSVDCRRQPATSSTSRSARQTRTQPTCHTEAHSNDPQRDYHANQQQQQKRQQDQVSDDKLANSSQQITRSNMKTGAGGKPSPASSGSACNQPRCVLATPTSDKEPSWRAEATSETSQLERSTAHSMRPAATTTNSTTRTKPSAGSGQHTTTTMGSTKRSSQPQSPTPPTTHPAVAISSSRPPAPPIVVFVALALILLVDRTGALNKQQPAQASSALQQLVKSADVELNRRSLQRSQREAAGGAQAGTQSLVIGGGGNSTAVMVAGSGPPPTCGYPGSPAHASVTFNTSHVVAGTAASYTCDNGYELLGPPRRICQANGTWAPIGIPFCGKYTK